MTVQPLKDAPDGTVTVYRYRAWGDLPEPVRAELRLRHDAENRAIAAWKAFDAAYAAAWEQDPAVAPLLEAERRAREAAEAAKEAASRAGSREGYAAQRGDKTRLAAARAAARDARAARAAANAALRDARTAVRQEKNMRRNAVARLQDHARAVYEAELKAIPPWYTQSGGYWANSADALDYHRTAAGRVAAARSAGQAASLSFRRWDGTGTITVVLMRHPAITAELRAEVARRKDAGESNKSIGADLGMTPMAVARMKPEGPVTKGTPRRTPAVLASEGSPWRNVARLSALPEGFGGMRRGERRRAARMAVVAVRTGSEANRAVSELPLVMHRAMAPDADVTLARVTVSRQGPDVLMHVSFTARLPVPARREGGLVCVHAGWRVLADGSLRVAVISGAGPVPLSLSAPGGPGGRGSVLDGCVRPLPSGGWEVVIPGSWRAGMDGVESLRGERDKARDRVVGDAAAWLDAHPRSETVEGEPLPAGHEVRKWRSPGRLAVLGRRCREGVYGDAAVALGELIGAWSGPDVVAWRREARARRRLLGRRDDLFGRVAAWVCGQAGEVRCDGWDMRDGARRPLPGDDDPQAAAARANRVLAAPGELRSRLKVTAGMNGVVVTSWTAGDGGQVHAGCGGELDPDARRKAVRVACGRCGAVVDQDENVLRLMAAG